MALTTQDVLGAPRGPAAPPKQLQIEVLRPFIFEGRRQEVGEQLTVLRQFGVEMVSAGKACRVPVSAQPAPVAAPAAPSKAKTATSPIKEA